jgi:hypothetical protein
MNCMSSGDRQRLSATVCRFIAALARLAGYMVSEQPVPFPDSGLRLDLMVSIGSRVWLVDFALTHHDLGNPTAYERVKRRKYQAAIDASARRHQTFTLVPFICDSIGGWSDSAREFYVQLAQAYGNRFNMHRSRAIALFGQSLTAFVVRECARVLLHNANPELASDAVDPVTPLIPCGPERHPAIAREPRVMGAAARSSSSTHHQTAHQHLVSVTERSNAETVAASARFAAAAAALRPPIVDDAEIIIFLAAITPAEADAEDSGVDNPFAFVPDIDDLNYVDGLNLNDNIGVVSFHSDYGLDDSIGSRSDIGVAEHHDFSSGDATATTTFTVGGEVVQQLQQQQQQQLQQQQNSTEVASAEVSGGASTAALPLPEPQPGLQQ